MKLRIARKVVGTPERYRKATQRAACQRILRYLNRSKSIQWPILGPDPILNHVKRILLTKPGDMPVCPTYGMPIQVLRPSPNQEWPQRPAWLKGAVEKELGVKVLDARIERDNRIVVETEGETIGVVVRLTCDDD